MSSYNLSDNYPPFLIFLILFNFSGTMTTVFRLITIKFMKKDIHPEMKDVKIECACGKTFKAQSTRKKMEVEICSNCHPFYTGKEKIVDKMGRVEKFKKRQETAEQKKKEQEKREEKKEKKREKEEEKEDDEKEEKNKKAKKGKAETDKKKKETKGEN